MSEGPEYQYWWVNQNRAVALGLMGDYLWTAGAQGGSAGESSRNIQAVQPGDLIFSYADGAVSGIGLALRNAFEAPRPPELAPTGKADASALGWHLPVRFFELLVPLHPRPHMGALKSVLPQKHSPLRATGNRSPGVYLASISAAMGQVLRRLLAGQLEDIEAQIKAAVVSELADDWTESSIRRRTDLEPADKQQLIRARRGLGLFRRSLEKIETACRVTGLLDRRHLRACHIKPWSLSEDREKIDGCNGLLLSPHVAHLFARGYISFSDEGELLASRHLNPAILTAWSLRLPMKAGPFLARQCVYLDFHRRRVFDRPEVGRGGVSIG
jgi:putative restriction endonuclease